VASLATKAAVATRLSSSRLLFGAARFRSGALLFGACRFRSGASGRRVAGTASVSQAEVEVWAARIAALPPELIEQETLEDIGRLRLGRQKGVYNPKSSSLRRAYDCSASLVGGVLSHRDPLPDLDHHVDPRGDPVPEVALAGRSNAGKSSLLNAMTGLKPGPGSASVSARPGWTRSVQLFEMAEADSGEAVLLLADLPGYGPLPNTPPKERTAWARLTRHYLKRARRLRSVFVLIESSLGARRSLAAHCLAAAASPLTASPPQPRHSLPRRPAAVDPRLVRTQLHLSHR